MRRGGRGGRGGGRGLRGLAPMEPWSVRHEVRQWIDMVYYDSIYIYMNLCWWIIWLLVYIYDNSHLIWFIQ